MGQRELHALDVQTALGCFEKAASQTGNSDRREGREHSFFVYG